MIDPHLSLDVLYEDNHLLVVNKPAGLATMGGTGSRTTLHGLAGAYLKRKYNKPHGVYVGIVSRLDSMTSGVIVLARTSKAAARLNTQFAEQARRLNNESMQRARGENPATSIRKTYVAAVGCQTNREPHRDASLADRDKLEDYLYKDDAAHRMRACPQPRDGAKPATLLYQTLDSAAGARVLAVAPLTGRKHQIRVQLAARGWPILGDRKYGSSARWESGIALHSYQLTIEHPTRREPMTFECPLPRSWSDAPGKRLEARLRDLSW